MQDVTGQGIEPDRSVSSVRHAIDCVMQPGW